MVARGHRSTTNGACKDGVFHGPCMPRSEKDRDGEGEHVRAVY